MQRAELKDIENRQRVVTPSKSLKSATPDPRLFRDSIRMPRLQSETWPATRLAFYGVIVIAGSGVLFVSIRELMSQPVGPLWFMLVALTLVTGWSTLRMRAVPVSFSISDTFTIAAALLFGPAAGTVIVVIDALVMSLRVSRPNKRGMSGARVAFNATATALAMWVAAHAFFAVAGTGPLATQPGRVRNVVGPLAVFAAVYFLLNTGFVAVAVAHERRTPVAAVWRAHFSALWLSYFSGASIAALLVTFTRDLDISTLAVIVPLLVASYLTFRTAMGRVEDSNNHLSEVNRLYLSTIETLAMAIDAKDQTTHGHIRRVQAYTVGLAKKIGVVDKHLLKAIEAAALLHDMGKLAVPEYILNKPGKLTAPEFEKMKLHASGGADILSAIDFPYPVVPIVRHHHESWDGTGYPAGLKGTDIPIGARILAVVDCFDALTSDRPYRPRMSNADALKILLDRRGSTYDPLIIDAFVRVYEEIAPEQTIAAAATRSALNKITSSTTTRGAPDTRSKGDEIVSSADEMLTLFDLSRCLDGQASISEAGDVIATHLRRSVPFSLSVVYVYDVSCGDIVARHASGDNASLVRDLRIPLGAHLSGWVAANRQAVINSDPALDLGDIASASSPRLRSSLSIPLTWNEELIGVLSLYSTATEFTDDQRRMVEAVGYQTAHTFRPAEGFDTGRAFDRRARRVE
jgi:putative nucleotidyltransferase with HDIG domain